MLGNLQLLCRRCHHKKTAEDAGKRGPRKPRIPRLIRTTISLPAPYR
jgi:5-methylcytosine-specific restriction endonuclease McrA